MYQTDEVVRIFENSKYAIEIVLKAKLPRHRPMTKEEIRYIIKDKKHRRDGLSKSIIQYDKEMIIILEKENADIENLNILDEPKYQKMFHNNLINIPKLYNKISEGENKILQYDDELHLLDDALLDKITISTKTYCPYYYYMLFPELYGRRRDEKENERLRNLTDFEIMSKIENMRSKIQKVKRKNQSAIFFRLISI